ncbi:MAG: WhiB family transcriptional regulator [Acidimicrobiales bacterium]
MTSTTPPSESFRFNDYIHNSFDARVQVPDLSRGACFGGYSDDFYPDGTEGRDPYMWARRVCADCPVRLECLDYALRANEVHGMWGGATPLERRGMKRKSRAVGA